MPEQHAYVRYHDGIEVRTPDEDEVVGKTIQSMTHESQIVSERHHHAVRASHAKSTGLLKGELRVLDGLPEPLRQGLFAEPRTYRVVVRLAQGPGEKLPDCVSTHRGMAIKVFGVEGPLIAGDQATGRQDFVFATGTTFPQTGASTFLTAMKGLELSTPAPEALKQAASSTARAANAALNAAGGDSPTLGFFGHTKRNPLADAYLSQTALRYGDYIAKMGAFPVSPDLIAQIGESLDTNADPSVPLLSSIPSSGRASGPSAPRSGRGRC